MSSRPRAGLRHDLATGCCATKAAFTCLVASLTTVTLCQSTSTTCGALTWRPSGGNRSGTCAASGRSRVQRSSGSFTKAPLSCMVATQSRWMQMSVTWSTVHPSLTHGVGTSPKARCVADAAASVCYKRNTTSRPARPAPLCARCALTMLTCAMLTLRMYGKLCRALLR